MINATTKCIPIPDPDLIKSCCHHLLFLIPPQYLYLLPPSYKEREKKKCSLLMNGVIWLYWLNAGQEASVAYSPDSICYYFSLFPACCEIWFLPKVAFVCTIVNSIIVCHSLFPRCSGSYYHTAKPFLAGYL